MLLLLRISVQTGNRKGHQRGNSDTRAHHELIDGADGAFDFRRSHLSQELGAHDREGTCCNTNDEATYSDDGHYVYHAESRAHADAAVHHQDHVVLAVLKVETSTQGTAHGSDDGGVSQDDRPQSVIIVTVRRLFRPTPVHVERVLK